METILIRCDEAAKLLNYSRARVYAMAASGELPALRSGRTVRIPRAALLAWAAKNIVGG